MQKAILVIQLVLLSFGTCQSQSLFEQFKALENEVKYTHPNALEDFANKLDTSTLADKSLYYWVLGRLSFWNSDYPNSYIYLEKAVVILDSLDFEELQAQLYMDLSSTLAVVDQNGKAMSYLLKAKDIIERQNNPDELARVNISLAELYRKTDDHSKAKDILRKTRSIAELNPYNHARYLNRLAAVHSEKGDGDSSLHYSFLSLAIATEIKEPDLMATAENEIGYIYRNRNQYEKALTHFGKADSLWKSIGKLRYAINAMHHISIIYGVTEEIEKSLDITHEAYKLVKDKNWYQVEFKLLEDLISLKVYLNESDSVAYYEKKKLEAIINWKDQQYAINTRMVEALFAQEKNEKIINEQKTRIEREELEKKALDQERNALIIIAVLIGLLLLIIFIYAFNQRKLKVRLSQENSEKAKKNEELSQALLANEALVQEISHRVKNNLAVLSGLLNLQSQRTASEEVSKELQDSILRIDSIATIHKKLYDKRSDAKVNLKEVLQDLASNVLISMGRHPEKCLQLAVDEVEIDISKGVTFCLIVNEVITNSCKYGLVDERNKLIIELTQKNKRIICGVKERGKGFEIKETTNDLSSLGLYLINLLGKQLKATIGWHKTEDFFIFQIEFDLEGDA